MYELTCTIAQLTIENKRQQNAADNQLNSGIDVACNTGSSTAALGIFLRNFHDNLKQKRFYRCKFETGGQTNKQSHNML